MDERPEGPVPILEDFLTLLDASGNEKWRFSILEVIKSTHPEFLDQGKWRKGDLSHTNTLHVLAPNTAGPAFAKGNILTSMNALGLIAVLDPEKRQFTWVRKTHPDGQHDPKMLDNGNILFFDNRESAGASAVLEIDPSTDRVEWQYLGSTAEPFYSLFCGAAERLLSGNTLITESYGGRAFEVDRAGEIVWEFFNPQRAGDDGEFIAAISEMARIPTHATKAWLQDPMEP
jgi:outer membrane protein assembly factor BamB